MLEQRRRGGTICQWRKCYLHSRFIDEWREKPGLPGKLKQHSMRGKEEVIACQ
jgi:hypothetical protein